MALSPSLVVEEGSKHRTMRYYVAACLVFLVTVLILAWVHFVHQEPHHALLDVSRVLGNSDNRDELTVPENSTQINGIPQVIPCHFIAGLTFGRTGNAMTILATVLAFAK